MVALISSPSPLYLRHAKGGQLPITSWLTVLHLISVACSCWLLDIFNLLIPSRSLEGTSKLWKYDWPMSGFITVQLNSIVLLAGRTSVRTIVHNGVDVSRTPPRVCVRKAGRTAAVSRMERVTWISRAFASRTITVRITREFESLCLV